MVETPSEVVVRGLNLQSNVSSQSQRGDHSRRDFGGEKVWSTSTQEKPFWVFLQKSCKVIVFLTKEKFFVIEKSVQKK